MYTCRNHPSYRGLSKPSDNNVDCITCWKIYAEMLEYQVQHLRQQILGKRKKVKGFQNSSY
jgi:hypothetical protein